MTAAKLVCGYWIRLVRLDGERLAKQAFLRNLELSGQPLGPRDAGAPWARQVHSFLAASHTACDLVHPTEVDVKEVIATLECRHLESTLGPKSQHYVDNVRAIDKQSYTTPAAYLQMVTKWSDRKRLAQLRTGSHWLAEETGRMARTEPRTAPMPALQQRRHRRCAAKGVRLCRVCRTANAAPRAFLDRQQRPTRVP